MVVEASVIGWIHCAGCVLHPSPNWRLSMQTGDSTAVLEGWLSGAESAHGLANPAGPLYVGGNAAEASLVDPTDMLYAFCSSPSGSQGSWCC
jgi:hypothetical protein